VLEGTIVKYLEDWSVWVANNDAIPKEAKPFQLKQLKASKFFKELTV